MDIETALKCADGGSGKAIKVLAARVRSLEPIVRALSEKDVTGYGTCLFCGDMKFEGVHKPTCAWVLAKRAMGGR